MKLVRKKKVKLKLFNFFILLIVIGCISFVVYSYIKIPIKNIMIKNNTYLTDDYIIDLAGIKDYPVYYKYPSLIISKKIKKSPYISDVKVTKKFFHVIEIKVTEKKPLFYRDSDKKIIFNDKSELEENPNFISFRIPRLLNYIPNNIYEEFIKCMDKVRDDTISKISEILYDPNEIDNERFLLYMDDGNMVYLTITKFKMINYYNTVLEQLENRKGILYLDNGNHFQIKE